jgi:thermospermine synthase
VAEHHRAELEKRTEQFDIIIGDLADPVAGGPCYQLYTKSFYERILKSRLKEGGILVTQVSETHSMESIPYSFSI